MIEQLIACGVHPTQARLFADPLKAAMALYYINTDVRRAAFVAQLMVESIRFTSLEENLYYTTARAAQAAFGSRVTPHLDRVLRNPKAMANFAYADRNGNGPEIFGDGWKYRGRGLIMLTGKANYLAASYGCGRGDTYVEHPELVAQPSDACLTAAWYWFRHGCNDMADAGRFDRTTLAINGQAMLHSAERRQAFTQALSAFEGAMA